jgi:hypothetical protein
MAFKSAGRMEPGFRAHRSRRLGLALSLLLLTTLALGGCAAPSEVTPEAAAKLKTLGVISLIGGTLKFEQLSLTAFSNEHFEYPATEFGIDTFTAQTVAKSLAGRYDVRPVKFNPADFADDKITLKDETSTFDSGEPIGAVIRAKASPNDLDAYIVVTDGTGMIGNSNQTQSGVGMRRQHRLLWHDYFTHAIYYLTVVDGHTGKVIAQSMDPAWGGTEVDESYWPFDEDNISADQAKKIAEVDKQDIASSMPDALKALNLLPQ